MNVPIRESRPFPRFEGMALIGIDHHNQGES